MKRFVLLFILLPALIAAEVKLPEKLTIKAGRLGKLTADSTTPVKWINLSSDLDMIPSESGKWVILSSPTPGVYQVAAYTADKDGASDPAICTITVVSPQPPTPPTPPVPVDPLTASFQSLYNVETASDKATNIKALASLYSQSSIATDNTALKTVGDLLSTMKTASASLLPSTALLPIRGRIQQELLAVLPTDTTVPLDSTLRASAKSLFTRIATSLQGVK